MHKSGTEADRFPALHVSRQRLPPEEDESHKEKRPANVSDAARYQPAPPSNTNTLWIVQNAPSEPTA